MNKCLGHDLGLVPQLTHNLINPLFYECHRAGSLFLVSCVSSEFWVNLFPYLTLSQSSSLPTRTPTSHFLPQHIGQSTFLFDIYHTRDSLYRKAEPSPRIYRFLKKSSQREERTLQVLCYRAGDKTGNFVVEDRKDSEVHLPDS